MNETRILNRFQYYMEDIKCIYCLHYQSKKRGCALEICGCEAEKQEALQHGRIKRKLGAMRRDSATTRMTAADPCGRPRAQYNRRPGSIRNL